MNRAVQVLVAAPAVLLAAGLAVALALSVLGDHPLWRTEPLNLAEAAALRDSGEVARLLAAGADPRAAMPVRAGFLYQHQATLTPAEAAILADRPEILQLLVDYGLSFDRDQWARAWCAAGADTKTVLEQARPADAARACARATLNVDGPADLR